MNELSSRRNFVKTSILGLTGAALAPIKVLPDFKSNVMGFYSNSTCLSNDTTSAIRKYRMRDVEIVLLDRQGKPLKNKEVEVSLVKHAFLFGDCNPKMDSLYREGAMEKLYVYRKVFSEVLNAVNATCYWTERPRNNMAKTEAYQGEYKIDGFADTVDWGNANGLTVKGHPLFWTVPKAIPDWLLKYDYQTQWKFVEVRLRNLVSRFKGKVKLWDAVNEMLWEPALKNLSEREWPYLETLDNMAEYISQVLHICREEDPSAQYLLNDYGLERDHNRKDQLIANDNDPNAAREAGLRSKDGRLVNAKIQRKRYLELVKRLIDMGSPPAAIGLQGHSGAVTDDEQISFYDEMSQAGLPLHITEFWARANDFDDEVQKMPTHEQDVYIAEYVKKFVTNAFAHPAIESFFFWGFMGMATKWPENNSPTYEKKPLFNTLKELIHKTWHTHELLKTNSEGRIQFRGFYGNYILLYNLKDGAAKNMGISFELNKYDTMPYKLSTMV